MPVAEVVQSPTSGWDRWFRPVALYRGCTADNGGQWRSVAVRVRSEVRIPSRISTKDQLSVSFAQMYLGALGRIRTCAHGSGGRCSIP
jgi:hypothetical protein